MPPIVTDLIPVPVHGHTLFVANEHRPLVPLRPICDALGIDFRVQQRKLSSHPTFEPTVVMMTTVGADGKVRDMLAMPADMVMGWLMTIHPDKVAAKVRETLIAFQRSASRLLHDAWAAVRAGLPLPTGNRPQPDLFGRAAQPSDWLRHPAVQEAVLLAREAQSVAMAAQAQRFLLRRRARKLAKQAGLSAGELDALTLWAFWPPARPQAELPLLNA